MKKFIEKICNLNSEIKILIFSFLFLGILSAVFEFGENKADSLPHNIDSSKSVDTFIPKGFVLVPIELSNADSLSSLIGDLGGVVDLYLTSGHDEKRKTNHKVASKLKIIKAPLNPQQYAVLIKEGESSSLLSLPGPFIAIVQNPSSKGSEVTQPNQRKSIQVEYQK